MKSRRFGRPPPADLHREDDDPLAGVANLLDLGLVFIVGLVVSLFAAYRLEGLFDPQSSLTLVKQDGEGRLELIRKDGRKIEAVKMSRQEAEGRGVRLGVAYRLEDGTMVYLPDGER
ncbi:MAG: DUF2149 domain-containing protein [Planctomycetota bacterium]|jgi:hypothetical protein|nr:DUF2149 domain-containing protein [Planctomycetota bacterium]